MEKRSNLIIVCFVAASLCNMLSASDIHEAVRRGDIDRICEIIRVRPGAVEDRATMRPVTETLPMLQEATALHFAAQAGQTEIVRTLLDAGADVNAKNPQDITPLHLGVWSGSRAVVQILIDRGADVSLRNNRGNGMTALDIAAMVGAADIIPILIAAGSEVNEKDPIKKQTPLHFAAAWNQTAAIEELLRAGADINARDAEGHTPLHLTIPQKQRNKKSINVPAIAAAQCLIKHGAALNIADSDNKTPLALARSIDCKELIELLKQAGGADIAFDIEKLLDSGDVRELENTLKHAPHIVNAPLYNGLPPLLSAIKLGNEAACNVLLDAGANPLETDADGNNALHLCAAIGLEKAAERLASNGVLISAINAFEQTPLDVAEAYGRTNIAEIIKLHGGRRGVPSGRVLILRSGDEIQIKHPETKKRVTLKINDNIARINLSEATLKKSKRLFDALFMHDLTAMRQELEDNPLLSNVPFINSGGTEGITPLHAAVEVNDPQAVVLLLQFGARINATDLKGRTPLHIAAEKGRNAVAQLLAENGADPHKPDYSGCTAVELAIDPDLTIYLDRIHTQPQVQDAE